MPKNFIQFDFNSFSRKVLGDIGETLKRQAIKNIKEKSSGRIYKIKGRKHIASKPYHSPNALTNSLTRSIKYKLFNNNLVFGGGSSIINYAKFLELGTRKMEPRPLFHLSIFQKRVEIDSLIDRHFGKRFKIKVGSSRFSVYKTKTLQPQRTLYFGMKNFDFKQVKGKLRH